jgi:two-component system, NarL family, invasion response regulator UvrY
MKASGQKNIVLVDDHVIIRNGLKVLIEKLGNYHISAQFDDGASFLNQIDILKSTTDLVIMDLSMPEMTGTEVMQALSKKAIDLPVLILTLNEAEDLIVPLFRLGVKGYLKKNCSAQEMQTAIADILNNGYYHNEFLTLSIRHNTIEKKKTESELILEQLTQRERTFLKHVCHEKEYTYQQIADLMSVEPRTVDGYRESIFQKFNIKSKTGLVLFVLKYQLMEKL